MEKEKIPCTVEILTLNSEKTLQRCLESVKNFAEIIILDGNSTDKTIEIAKQYTDKIYPQTDSNEPNVHIEHFANTRNNGIKLANYDWFLYIDSDEYLSKGAVQEISEIIARGSDNRYFVYKMPRQPVLGNKVLEKLRPSFQVRFFYLPAVEGFVKRVHERIKVKVGYGVGILKHPEYVPLEDVNILKEKWSGYIDMQMQDINKVTLKLLFLKTRANMRKFLAYWAKYILGLVLRPRSRLPFWYEYHNAMYHLKIIWRIWGLFIKQRL